MEMDVCGIKPTSERGKRLGVNLWSWREIHRLIVMACDGHRRRTGRTLLSEDACAGTGRKNEGSPGASR